ncbi:MAG: hypothetical protein AVDCRST_MAG93-2408 [uncultured Chloroflexia bacterium]|uniref:DUF306 domain-containing protein n=1 Tax=uncultured Chloroflexia bacterium TaxID=1672391 RepID=A0A6J4J270_9CHLR|nr:MAG: hypothetical protein AVDCRST_MAG93-2408 [uncultured Chloroflexia bacterium]
MRITIIACLMLAGCAGMGGGQIGGGNYAAVNINGVPVEQAAAPTLRLEGGRVSGTTGCNSYSGGYQFSSRERVSFTAITTTRMACAQALMDQERRFLSILESTQGYSLYGDRGISLIAADGRAIRFRRK